MTSEALPPTATPGVFDNVEHADFPHQRVAFCYDRRTGLRAIIAIHSLALGPAIGGCRIRPYADENAALADALRLSRSMTYKAASAGLDHGGGKAVIIGDPANVKSRELFEAFGRFVEEQGGRYITACDVGTVCDDMDIIGGVTRHVAFRSTAVGGSGDSGLNTALGVLQAMRAGAEAQWGTAELTGRTVGVEGLGKVGYNLVSLLHAEGAQVVATDVSAAAIERTRTEFPEVRIAESVLDAPVDIYAPCALGGTIDTTTVERITARLVCGGANNQLADPALENTLAGRGVLWVPDYVANAGGLIQAAGEVAGWTADATSKDVEAVFDTAKRVIDFARDSGVTTGVASRQLADQRIRAAESD
ncbi:Glu/Leu/Phe/Val dehydrogenase dimerization domain-containing protein [Sphaerisporangium sp. NPDC051011]|uniref:Glu/Leu/Phe/Val family dehydrogenase n=1 Tax=Sphaerisporangium sp. NPDC051011 TaxID=3155792 RepID=UPI0033EC71ED